jgi:hypothetical protein
MPSEDSYERVKRTLDPDTLVAEALEQTGAPELPDNGSYEPLCKLVDCLARDMDFHEQGLAGMRYDLLRNLTNQLRLEADLSEHPEILEEDVSDPIIIIGLPRSGTTKLQRLLSAPESVQKLYLWRALNPGRFPDADPGEPDPRIAAADMTDLIAEDNKEARDAAHLIDPLEVEEDCLFYMLTFDDWMWNIRAYIPSYYPWVMGRPSQPTYEYARMVLQNLQWQDGGARGRPWILKSIGYLPDFDSLFDCYPNATYVHPHRDPRSCVPSFTKFIAGMRLPLANPVDPRESGREMLMMYETATNRYLEVRDRLQLDDRILDVTYEEVRTDPMSIAERIYDRAGRTLDDAAHQSMEGWHDANEQGRFGAHEYSLEEFGLTEQMIDDAFGEYIDRFIDR